jgi:hypothetical protein
MSLPTSTRVCRVVAVNHRFESLRDSIPGTVLGTLLAESKTVV